jgi:F420-0:gamma-glutamyl ligase
MSITEIKKLPIREKFQILEALWEDMREEIEDTDIPESHKKILDDCEARVLAGEEKFYSLEEARNMIGR